MCLCVYQEDAPDPQDQYLHGAGAKGNARGKPGAAAVSSGGKKTGNNNSGHKEGGIELQDIPLQMGGPSSGRVDGNNNDDDYFPEGSQFSYEVTHLEKL